MIGENRTEQFSVKVQLIVKAETREEARQIVERRLLALLQEWFAEDDHASAPFPTGSLLMWNVGAK